MAVSRRVTSLVTFFATVSVAVVLAYSLQRGKPVATVSGSALVGRPAPGFTLPNLNGDPVSLSDSRGKVVVLDLWATWCPPCVEELPIVNEVTARYADRGVVFHAVEVNDNTTVINAFLKRHGWKVPVLVGQEADVAERYAAQYIPLLVVIDRDGVIRFCDNVDPAAVEATLTRQIENALKSGQAA